MASGSGWRPAARPAPSGAPPSASARSSRWLPARIADLAIVAAELTSNLVKHADEGVLLLRPVRRAGQAGVELVAIDSGPGMADLTVSSQDGHSTTGTLGIGLGAIVRQASWFDGYSLPGRGTVLAVQVWPAHRPEPSWAGALTRPLTGETVSGDGYAVRVADGRHQVLVSDGLGHGPLAAAATEAALAAFRDAPASPPAAVVEPPAPAHVAHPGRRAGGRRAGARRPACCTTPAWATSPAWSSRADGHRRGLVSLPGIAGHQRPTSGEYDYPFGPGALLVMHSDGVVDRWRLADYPGLPDRSPLVVAATLLRDAGMRRDDACVLVARSWT